jgi:orotidine-5'-phosphate decarboxylase
VSPDAIISALKQGNALELEFVKKLKEGLDFIAHGMQMKCYKRGDALEELRESLEPVCCQHRRN